MLLGGARKTHHGPEVEEPRGDQVIGVEVQETATRTDGVQSQREWREQEGPVKKHFDAQLSPRKSEFWGGADKDVLQQISHSLSIPFQALEIADGGDVQHFPYGPTLIRLIGSAVKGQESVDAVGQETVAQVEAVDSDRPVVSGCEEVVHGVARRGTVAQTLEQMTNVHGEKGACFERRRSLGNDLTVQSYLGNEVGQKNGSILKAPEQLDCLAVGFAGRTEGNRETLVDGFGNDEFSLW